VTNSWDEEYAPTVEGDGKRAHISKTIGSTDVFFNFRSSAGEDISTSAGGAVAGIAVNGSTEFTGLGVAWDDQVGHTNDAYSGSNNVFGNVDKLILAGGDCHFFATATTLTGVFQTESVDADWREITIGTVGGLISYFVSGGIDSSAISEDYDARSAYCATANAQGTGTVRRSQSAIYDGTGWFTSMNQRSGSATALVVNNPVTTFSSPVGGEGSTIMEVLFQTPDAFRGNAQLFPSDITVTQGTINEYYPVGDIEGVKFINMTNYSNGQEVTNGEGDIYKLFRIWNGQSAGFMGAAFLVN
jgi:hypothetical protein